VGLPNAHVGGSQLPDYAHLDGVRTLQPKRAVTVKGTLLRWIWLMVDPEPRPECGRWFECGHHTRPPISEHNLHRILLLVLQEAEG
jgi:hypothetical protein